MRIKKANILLFHLGPSSDREVGSAEPENTGSASPPNLAIQIPTITRRTIRGNKKTCSFSPAWFLMMFFSFSRRDPFIFWSQRAAKTGPANLHQV